jgi:AcrR family transcriptional regulator
MKTDRYHPVMARTDAEIAAVAAEQFHEHGITSTGVDALARAAGISKRTLYQRFGSKDGLIVAAYESLDLPVYEMFTRPAEAASDDPAGQLDALFAGLEYAVTMPEFRGCPFSNAAAELADPGHPAHAIVRRHKERLRKWMRVRLRDAGTPHPDLASRQLAVLWAGAQAQALVQRSAAPVRDARALARSVVLETEAM